MGILKPVLVLAILSSVLLCNNAWATSPPPRIGAVPDAPKATSKPLAPAPAKKPPKRRAVRQIIDGTPAPLPPVVYGPQLSPAPPIGLPPPPSPLILQNCQGGSCSDANGTRYHGGIGNTLLSPQGRVCSDNGLAVQCF
ncbi:MAG: hypothetical protein V4631_08410 [Pseudomonadota bacterium]